MKYTFFTIPARYPASAQDELNAFLSRHRIVYVDKQLVADGADSFWSICVSWLDGEAALSMSNSKQKPRVDYKEILSETDFTRYLQLHALRKEWAKQHTIPTYNIFTNEQLAAMVQQRVQSKAELQAIEGVGKARLDKYGDIFLQKLRELWIDEAIDKADEAEKNQP